MGVRRDGAARPPGLYAGARRVGSVPVMRRVAVWLGLALAGLALALATGWGALAVFYLGPGSVALRTGLAYAFAALGLGCVGALFARRTRRPAAALALALGAFALFCWMRTEPSNDRDWQTDVAVLPYATFDGDLVTVHNIRNFDYRSE